MKSLVAAALLGAAVMAVRLKPDATLVVHAQTQAYDVLIKNGRIVDGTGSAWYRGDVAVRGDTIAKIAWKIDAPAAKVIDATGKVVAPGFIDLHTHARRGIMQLPTAENYVRQGVTTLMEGPDGGSPPIKEFLDQITAKHISPNMGL